MDEHANPYDAPESRPDTEASPPDAKIASGLPFRQQPLAWQVSSVTGMVVGFAGVLIAIKYVDVPPTGMCLIFGGWMSLCMLPASFFVPARYVDRPVRNWLHALSPSLVILLWCFVSAAAQYWGGDSLAKLIFSLMLLGSALISLRLSKKAARPSK